MPQLAKPNDLTWLLNDVVSRVPALLNAVVLSDDGLLMAADGGLRQETAEHLAACASGYQSLSRSAGGAFEGGPIRQTVVEMTTRFLFITSAGNRSCLAVLCTSDADVGLIAYEMAVLVKQVHASLSTSPRPGVPAGDAS
jgi:predicted regulator of Ras-like GTPase activity (Roadblock/LC7/MglB family)